MRRRTACSSAQHLHTLFDRGYLTVTPEHRLEVSRRIHDEFHSGKEYYALHGTTIRAPAEAQRRPAAEYLRWHNEQVFRDLPPVFSPRIMRLSPRFLCPADPT